jgi:hypothetical protein
MWMRIVAGAEKGLAWTTTSTSRTYLPWKILFLDSQSEV